MAERSVRAKVLTKEVLTSERSSRERRTGENVWPQSPEGRGLSKSFTTKVSRTHDSHNRQSADDGF